MILQVGIRPIFIILIYTYVFQMFLFEKQIIL